MIVLALPVVLIVAVTLHDVLRRPTLRRLALRNAARRKGEALLVLAGSLLGTAIITASFLVGDTLGASIRDFARTQLGPVDEGVRVVGAGPAFTHLAAALAPPPAGTDGTLTLIRTTAAAASTGARTRAEPKASLLETDFDAARRFGGDPGATGLTTAGPTPSGDQAVIGRDLARKLGLRPGDHLDVFAYGARRTLTVRGVVPRVGIAGFWPAQGSSTSPNVFVAPGTIASMAAVSRVPTAAPPDGWVLVSNDGGVFDGARQTAAVHRAIDDRVRGLAGAEVIDLKRTLLDNADANAKSFTALFGGIGAFSVIAGILLLVNVFVMLADERKSELGMLRAVGLKRNQLVRAFGMEGALYSVVAAAVGALAGIALGRVIVIVAERIFNSGDEAFRITMRFSARFASVAGGFVIGAAISLVTVWLASARIGRLNVIRAIRDLPEPPRRAHRLRALVLAALGVAAGGAMVTAGAAGRGAWFPALAGFPLAAFSSVPLLSRLLPRRLALSGACLATLVWCVTAFTLLPRAFEGAGIPTFVVQGVLLVLAAVTLVTHNDDGFAFVAERLSASNRALAARLGLAYPLARKFRTAMLLGMYALVIFTLTFLSVFSKLFGDQGPRFTRQIRSGYDIVADSNPGNPATVEQLRAQPGVAAAAPLLRAFPEFSTATQTEPMRWALTGFGPALLDHGNPSLSKRLARFRTDRAAWDAVLHDPSLVIVPDFFLQHGGGPPSNPLRTGDILTVHNRASGEQRRLTVAGVVGSDFVFNGAMVGADFARSFLGPQAVADRHYVQVVAGADPHQVAVELTGRLVEEGMDARSIADIIRSGLQQNEGFFRLMQGYLALGLLVGIAGLGVVMVRAVRERRRQIGMLRAMGFSHRLVRAAFLFEAAFVAVQGIVLGVGLALVVSYQLLSNSGVFGDQRLHFTIPWLALLLVLLATLAASVVAALVPASQASRIKPAVALRIAD